MIYWPDKGPADVTDFGMSWGPFLSKLDEDNPPTILTTPGGSTWSVISGDVSILANVVDGDARGTEVRISGGTAGTEYIVRNQVTLSDGQSFHEDAFGKIRA